MAITTSIRAPAHSYVTAAMGSDTCSEYPTSKLSSSVSIFNISDDKINAMIRVGSSDASHQLFQNDIRPHKPSCFAVPAGLHMKEGDLFWTGFQLDAQEHISWIDSNPITYSAAGNSATLFYFSQGAGQPARAGYMGNRKALTPQK